MHTPPVLSARVAAELIGDNCVISISSSSALGCPDLALEGIGARFAETGHPRNVHVYSPIAAGDMYGVTGIDHLAVPGLMERIVAGSYPSGPSSAPPPAIWSMIEADQLQAYNLPSGVLYQMHRAGAAAQPGVFSQVGLGTFVDPRLDGGRMNDAAAQQIVSVAEVAGQEWLHYPAVRPDVAVIRATTADENGNLTFEEEGSTLGALDLAYAAHNSGGVVIAQVKRLAAAGSLRAQDVRVPGILIDAVVARPRAAPDDQDGLRSRAIGPAAPAIQHRGTSAVVPGEGDRPPGRGGIERRGHRQPGLRRRRAGAAHPGRAGPGKQRQLAARAGRGRRRPADRLRVRLLAERLGPHVVSLISSPSCRAAASTTRCCRSCRSTGKATSTFTTFRGGVTSPPASAGFADITSRAKSIVFIGAFNAGRRDIAVRDGALDIRADGPVAKIVDQVSASDLLRAPRAPAGAARPLHHRALRAGPGGRRPGPHRDRSRHRRAAGRARPHPVRDRHRPWPYRHGRDAVHRLPCPSPRVDRSST